ncbi:hypothetical protein DVH05_027202 [Phytophthora capsici]|nr:hypothetical protein DVH05_027202 [Phytophthora capsici]
MSAAAFGYVEIVKLLLSKGVWVDQQRDDGITALHQACVRGQVDVVRSLLENGARVDFADAMEVVALLFEKGARLEKQNVSGSTALDLACSNGQYGVTNYLLASGAVIDTTDNDGSTPLMRVAAGRNTKEEDSARSYDRMKSFANVAKLLLNAGANVKKQRNLDGDTALHVACYYGCVEVAAALIEQGAAIEVNKRGCTPLHLASRHGNSSAMVSLLKNGADNKKGSTTM